MIIIGLTLLMNWINSNHVSKIWFRSLFHIRTHSYSPEEMAKVEDELNHLKQEEEETVRDISVGDCPESLADQEKRVNDLGLASKRLTKIKKQQEKLQQSMKRKKDSNWIRTTLRGWLKTSVELCYDYWNSILSCLLLGLMTIGGDS